MAANVLRLDNARVVFTGKLASMTRTRAWEEVRKRGGTPERTVTRRTSLVVVGADGWPLLPDGTLSGKLRRAETLAREGLPIEILPEIVFLERIGLAPGSQNLPKPLSAEQVQAALGLDPASLRRWELLGLVRPVEGRYDFLDIASLRTLAELIGRGVQVSTISASLRRLRTVFPAVDRPLAQLSILANEAQALLVRHDDMVLEPDGQLVFGFEASPDQPLAEASGAHGTAEPIPLTARPALSGEEWFDRGQRLEDLERYDEAVSAYREAIGACGHFPEAFFNLGNALRSAGRCEAAEEAYRLCLVQDPTMAEAWYNLGDVLEEAGRIEESVECLQRATRACPAFADAHFNLASCCEKLGRFAEASEHWQAYLHLDSQSQWAAIARRRLAAHA